MGNSRAKLAIASATTIAVLAMTACSNSGGKEDAASASPSSTAALATTGASGELTPPGTQLAIGQTAVVHSSSGGSPSDDNPKFSEAIISATVLRIEAGTLEDLADFPDAAKFAGQTPYYVSTKFHLDSLSRPTSGLSNPTINGLLKDGSMATKLFVIAKFDKCAGASFDLEGYEETLTYKVGSTMTDCTVFLAPEGDAVTSASYMDQTFSYEDSKDNLYRKNPVIWK